MSFRALLAGTVAVLALPMAALAQTAIPLPPVAVETAPDTGALGATSVPDDQILQKQRATGDTAGMLDGVPGVNLLPNGGVSSLPSIHGLADDRILQLLDGVQTTSACPNHMNPPLSYAQPAAVGKVDVFTGVSPVSRGGDNIGGVVAIESKSPVFAAPGEGYRVNGQASAYYKSNASNVGTSAEATAAVENLSLGVTGAWNRADDYTSGNGATVRSTSFENENYAVTGAAQKDGQTLVVKGGQQYIPYEGFPNAAMDMNGNRQAFLNIDYKGEYDWGKLDALGYWNQISHQMDDTSNDRHAESYLALTAGMPMPMNTKGMDTGYSLKAEVPLSKSDTLRIGNELHLQDLNEWWPATTPVPGMMGSNAFVNIKAGSRDRLGTYAEWETTRWDPAWTTLIGVRNDVVWSNAANVWGYSDATYGADARAFNAATHKKIDVNFDATAIEKYDRTDVETWTIGFARKTRSPSLYERYTWSTNAMTSSMIGWFGDGNAYVGNTELKPESAHTASLTAELHDAARKDWSIAATPYYTYVHNYINVNYVGLNTYSGNGSNILQFNNHEAQLYGADLSGYTALVDDASLGHFGVSGVAGFVRGYQINNGSSLYHMMPLNTKLTLDHKLGGWSSAIDLRMVTDKSEADPLRQEKFTGGFAIVNLRTAYDWRNFRVDLGIENLFDHQYYDPLGGAAVGDYYANRTAKNSWPYTPLASMGRSFDAGITVKF